MCTLVNSLLQLERRKANNMSRLPSEESYQASTVILQGANMREGYSLIPNLPDRQVQKSDRINSDRQSGSDQLGSTRTNSDRIKNQLRL